MARLGTFGLCFAGIALAVNYYQNKRLIDMNERLIDENERLIEKVNSLLKNDYLFGKHIEEFYRRINNLEARLAKPGAKEK